MTVAVKTFENPEIVANKTRLTFEEAYESVLVNSQLRQIAEGKLEACHWNIALSQDIAAAQRFIDNFIEDLNLLSNPKDRYVQRISQLTLKTSWMDMPDQLERAKVLWAEFQVSLGHFTRKILDNIKARIPASGNQKSDFCLPLSWVVGSVQGRMRIEWADTPRQAVIRDFIDCAFKSPEDFTRKIPQDVSEALVLLKRTHYNYQEAFLDGTLVYEANVPMTIYPRDPALVLRLNWENRNLAVRYWKEPFTDKDAWSNPVVVPAVICFILCLFFVISGLSLLCNFDNALGFIGVIIMVLGALLGAGGAGAILSYFDEPKTLSV